jgi:hypothetical protein
MSASFGLAALMIGATVLIWILPGEALRLWLPPA